MYPLYIKLFSLPIFSFSSNGELTKRNTSSKTAFDLMRTQEFFGRYGKRSTFLEDGRRRGACVSVVGLLMEERVVPYPRGRKKRTLPFQPLRHAGCLKWQRPLICQNCVFQAIYLHHNGACVLTRCCSLISIDSNS